MSREENREMAPDGVVEAHEITEFEAIDVPDLLAESRKPRIGFVE